jgi:mannose-6-phosphate isomerase-like protein (cupin superfamily)
MSFDILRADGAAYEERPGHEGQEPRLSADVTVPANLTDSRARYWRYPAHTRGRRHMDHGQEEVFVCLRGTLTMLLGEPPQRVDLKPGDAAAVHRDTPMQARNETDEEVLFFAYGAPPVTGNAEFLDDVVDAPPA